MRLGTTVETSGGTNGNRREKSDGKASSVRSRLTQPLLLSCLAIAGIVAAIYGLKPNFNRGKAFFPHRQSEFFPPAELDRRLAETDAVLKTDPENIRALSESGMLHFQKGPDQYPDAINELEEARKLGALDPRIFYYLGVMYQEEGLYPFATEAYQRFLRNNPGDVEIRLLLAKLQFQGNQFDDAAVQYRRLMEIRPKDLLITENLALSLWKGGHREDAAKLFDDLAARNETVGRRAHFYLGEMAFEDKDYKQALRQYLAVLPLEDAPDLGLPLDQVHGAIAAEFQMVKLFKEAKEHWEKTLQYNPQYPQAKTGLKAVNAALDKAAKAAAKLRKKKKK